MQGIAPDGGLFLPQSLPALGAEDFAEATTLTEIANVLLSPVFEGSSLAPNLDQIIAETFSFDIPVSRLPS